MFLRCHKCGAERLPSRFRYCGMCGTPLDSESNETLNDVIQRDPESVAVLEEHGIHVCGGCMVLLNSPLEDVAAYSGLSAAQTAAMKWKLSKKETA